MQQFREMQQSASVGRCAWRAAASSIVGMYSDTSRRFFAWEMRARLNSRAVTSGSEKSLWRG